MKLIGIDPGPFDSAYCELIDGAIGQHGWIRSEQMLVMLRAGFCDEGVAIIESPQAQDRPLGKLLRDTIFWTARFVEVLDNRGTPYCEADERDVCLRITGNRSGNNAAILQALKDHFGDVRQEPCASCRSTGEVAGTRGKKRCQACKGKQFLRLPGALHGLNEHVRSSLAACLWYAKQTEDRRATA